MFRTVSMIRAQRGPCFIVTNTPASRQRSDRAPASLVEAGEGIEEGILRNIDLRVESPRGAWLSSIWVPFYLDPAGQKRRRYARCPDVIHTASNGPRARFSAQAASQPPPTGRYSTTAPMRPTAAPPPAPAAPSPLGGPASSARCPATLRSPPRPRGAANRAGERVTPLFLLEPPGPVAQRT